MLKCNVCEDKGFLLKKVMYDDDGNKVVLRDNATSYEEEVWFPCECRKKQDKEVALDYKLTEAGIHKSLCKYTFDDYIKIPFPPDVKKFNQSQVDVLTTIMNDPIEFFTDNNVLWLWGSDDNSGHTTLAATLGIKLIEKKFSVRFLKMQTLLDAFTDFDDKEYLEKLKGYKFYIIDDAFDLDSVTVGGPYTQVHLFQFIDNALLEDSKFIMTSRENIINIPEEFHRSGTVLRRSFSSLELRGDISTLQLRGKKK